MNILAIEPYLHGSHKAFLKGLCEYSKHNIIPVALAQPGGKWKMHGDAVYLANKTAELEEEIDLILASSMANIPAFVALTNPRFANTPKVLYMHENQLTQPLPEDEQRDYTYCYINYLSMLSVDKLVFTTQFHYNDFIEALPDFLRKYSNQDLLDTVDTIANKSIVMNPGLHLSTLDQADPLPKKSNRKVIVWNQRWQFDRNPAAFFRVLNRLDDAGFDFELILAGDTDHEKPEEFEQAWRRYGDRISHFGYVDDNEKYARLLQKGDIVVSTANYEFFCVAVMEAVYCGCHPLLPNKLHYPALIPDHLHQPLLHAPVLYESEDHLFSILRDILSGETKCLPQETLQKINRHLDWKKMAANYDGFFEAMVR